MALYVFLQSYCGSDSSRTGFVRMPNGDNNKKKTDNFSIGKSLLKIDQRQNIYKPNLLSHYGQMSNCDYGKIFLEARSTESHPHNMREINKQTIDKLTNKQTNQSDDKRNF